MTATLTLSADAQVIALACSGITGQGADRALSAKDWSQLARAIHSSDVERPGQLLGMSEDELQSALPLSPAAAKRLHGLLSRGAQLAIELERLSSSGIWLLTRADDAYPAQFKRRLREQAPPVLFGSGPNKLLTSRGLAIVGSRDADDEALEFASNLAQRAASQSFSVVSGAARGVDSTAMQAALEHGGEAVGITADPLERAIRRKDLRKSLERGSLCLVTPYHPAARWQVGNAMKRNRLIYALSDAAVVVATAARKGGTWSGAIEDLRNEWVPLWVRDDGSPGAAALVGEGARPLPTDELIHTSVAGLMEATVRSVTQSFLDIHVQADENLEPGSPSSGQAYEEPKSEGSSPTRIEGSVPHDAFSLVWPQMAEYLREPRSAREISDAFDLVTTQVRAWLTRAIEEGMVKQPARYRYVVADTSKQRSLFRSGDT
jgi:predicted Rossmann fold nucleotide-binding protein DprA/Smf involved in DNA uptake